MVIQVLTKSKLPNRGTWRLQGSAWSASPLLPDRGLPKVHWASWKRLLTAFHFTLWVEFTFLVLEELSRGATGAASLRSKVGEPAVFSLSPHPLSLHVSPFCGESLCQKLGTTILQDKWQIQETLLKLEFNSLQWRRKQNQDHVVVGHVLTPLETIRPLYAN